MCTVPYHQDLNKENIYPIMFFRFCLITIAEFCLGYENLALYKPTWQSNPYIQGDSRFDSSNAVDGLKYDLSPSGGQCVISGNEKGSATWWVNLGSVNTIHDIRIYYRTDNLAWDASNNYASRFMGFYVYISNTTNRLDGYLCFHDTKYTRSTIPSVVNITCPVYGQYIIYYNERPQSSKYASTFSQYAYNELCEVEVFECSGRYYGINCTNPCGDCLNFEQCHHVNGSCLNGCDLGFYGEKCDHACPLGLYGRNCERSCSVHCLDSDRCDKKSGACQGGCKTGWKGLKCESECDSNMFGEDCSKQCGHCLDGSQCQHINGSCLSGCDPGYIGDDCNEVCLNGTYGIGCIKTCSMFCLVSGICDHVTGACSNGCKNGWMGLDCLEVKGCDGNNIALYIVIGILCVCLLVNVLLLIYFIYFRGNSKQMVRISKYKEGEDNSTDVEDVVHASIPDSSRPENYENSPKVEDAMYGSVHYSSSAENYETMLEISQ